MDKIKISKAQETAIVGLLTSGYSLDAIMEKHAAGEGDWEGNYVSLNKLTQKELAALMWFRDLVEIEPEKEPEYSIARLLKQQMEEHATERDKLQYKSDAWRLADMKIRRIEWAADILDIDLQK